MYRGLIEKGESNKGWGLIAYQFVWIRLLLPGYAGEKDNLNKSWWGSEFPYG